jgi:hypothetical protein
MRQSISVLSLFASAAMAADVISFYFPGGKWPANIQIL